jgi:hypothetical protein
MKGLINVRERWNHEEERGEIMKNSRESFEVIAKTAQNAAYLQYDRVCFKTSTERRKQTKQSHDGKTNGF